MWAIYATFCIMYSFYDSTKWHGLYARGFFLIYHYLVDQAFPADPAISKFQYSSQKLSN